MKPLIKQHSKERKQVAGADSEEITSTDVSHAPPLLHRQGVSLVSRNQAVNDVFSCVDNSANSAQLLTTSLAALNYNIWNVNWMAR